LKHKSDVEQVFYAFQAHVEHLLDAKIKFVQSDRVVNITSCIVIFSARVSLTMCLVLTPPSRTAPLNASTATSLKLALLYLLTPLCHCYWDEAFLTACYLINRMPMPVLQKDIPVHRLFSV
jgi:predicted Na+-dependent transporter